MERWRGSSRRKLVGPLLPLSWLRDHPAALLEHYKNLVGTPALPTRARRLLRKVQKVHARGALLCSQE